MKKALLILTLSVSLFLGGFCVAQTQVDNSLSGSEEIQGVQRGFTYGGNVQQSKELFAEQEKRLTEKVRTLSLPNIIPMYQRLIEDIRALYPQYFNYVVFICVVLFTLCQVIMAKMLHHRHIWLSLFWLLAAGFWSLESVFGRDVVELPLLISLCVILPIWQLFRMAHVSFMKSAFLMFLFVLFMYILLVAEMDHLIAPTSVAWSFIILIVGINLFSNISFHCGRTSWMIFPIIVPVIGPVFFMTACVFSLMKKNRVNPVFVNLIIDMLSKDLSKIAIRQKALSAKVRLGYFEYHYDYAIKRFKRNKKAMLQWLYNLKFTVWNGLLIVVLAAFLGQLTLTGLTLFGYYENYTLEKRNDNFYRAIREDNVALIKRVLADGESLYPECDILPEIEMCDPVYSAVFYDSTRVLEVLIQAGARTNLVDERGWDPLEYATRRKKDVHIIKMLQEIDR